MIQRLFENFRKFISEDELFEGRLEDVKKKYPDHQSVVDVLSKNDPSGNNKYLDWMMNQYVNTGSLQNVVNVVKIFHQNLQRIKEKDINKYQSLEDLKNTVENLGQSGQEKRKKKKEVAIEGSEIIYEDENFFVVRPNTEEASCYYGRNTHWCIAATKSKNYFKSYTSQGKVFYFLRNENLPEDDAGRRLVFVFGRGGLEEIYDTQDSRISERSATIQIIRNVKVDDEKGEQIYRQLKSKMEEHAKDNLPELQFDEERLQQIRDSYNNQMEYCSVDYSIEDDGEGNYLYFSGWGGIEFDDLKQDFSWKDRDLRDKIEDIFHKNDIYGEVELESNKIDILFSSEENNDEDGFESFAERVKDMDENFSQAKEEIYRYLEQAGYVEVSEYTKFINEIKNEDFNHFWVDEKDNSINVELDVRIPDINIDVLRDSTFIFVTDIFMKTRENDQQLKLPLNESRVVNFFKEYLSMSIRTYDEKYGNANILFKIGNLSRNTESKHLEAIKKFIYFVDNNKDLSEEILVKAYSKELK